MTKGLETSKDQFMCEPLLPIHELDKLKWAVSSLAAMNGSPGSFEKENSRNAARGINERLDWVIRTLKAANEGQKNLGV